MFGSGNVWGFPLNFHSGNFKIFENVLRQFTPNHPPKHVITTTNLFLLYTLLSFLLFSYKQKIDVSLQTSYGSLLYLITIIEVHSRKFFILH